MKRRRTQEIILKSSEPNRQAEKTLKKEEKIPDKKEKKREKRDETKANEN